ncbi:MAG: GIY-YIG nuclease family protein [Imperialibacter sp.]|uniref:GIY-YIG nuclease family protein n=1 Tax=Imperialibacter sp. TaxID=2038411 RepID=UPI0032F06CA1
MNRYTVYILKCADGSYYTGVTNDIDRRLYEHQIGYDTKSYTFKRRPVDLVFTEHFGNINKAIAFEKQIKGWSRAKKEALMKQDWRALKERSKNRSGK